MRAKCLVSTVWYSLTFEAGVVYTIDDMLASRLIRSGKFKQVKEDPVIPDFDDDLAVGQFEAPRAFKPIATAIDPLPESDDLAEPPALPVVKPIKQTFKHKSKQKK
jgi:hypothetical protein